MSSFCCPFSLSASADPRHTDLSSYLYDWMPTRQRSLDRTYMYAERCESSVFTSSSQICNHSFVQRIVLWKMTQKPRASHECCVRQRENRAVCWLEVCTLSTSLWTFCPVDQVVVLCGLLLLYIRASSDHTCYDADTPPLHSSHPTTSQPPTLDLSCFSNTPPNSS